MMNREQRRKYAKKIRHDEYASECPQCKNLSRFIAFENKNGTCDLYCEVCARTVATGIDGLTPRTYVKIKKGN